MVPAKEPYIEGHNTWCVNVPGSLLVIPIADIAQMALSVFSFFVQNGYRCIAHDRRGTAVQARLLPTTT